MLAIVPNLNKTQSIKFMRYKNDSNCGESLPSDGITLSFVHAPFRAGKGAYGSGGILLRRLEGS